MHHARQFVLIISAACIGESTLWARSPSAPSQASVAPLTTDLSIQRTLLKESSYALAAGDYATARAKTLEVVTFLLARSDADRDAAWLRLLDTAGRSAYDAQDTRTANRAWQQVLDVRERTLPDEDPILVATRQNVAVTLLQLGDLQTARTVLEKVLEVRTRTLPDDDPELQKARLNVAAAIHFLGDIAGARALYEKVLEVESRTLSDDHPDLQTVRANLAVTIREGGDLERARTLEEKVLEVYSRTLPEEHPDLQMARQNLAVTFEELGDLTGARALFEKVLEIRSRTLPDDHPELLSAQENLAGTIYQLGDLAGARALYEHALEVSSRMLPDDHPDLQTARQNLAGTIYRLGDVAGARALYEKVLEVQSRTLPDDHPDLQATRQNLAVMVRELGDVSGARELEEKALELRLRTLPDDHPDLQSARQNLALTLKTLGDLAAARALEEKVLEVVLRTLPDEHPDVQRVRQNLAATLAYEIARAGESPGHEGQRTDDVDAWTERCIDLIGGLCRAQVRGARAAILASPGREAEERCSFLARALDESLSYAMGMGVFEPARTLEAESFVLSETTRGAAMVSAELAREASSAPKYRELRGSLSAASDELASLAQQGTSSAEFDRARTSRESVERELVALARELSGGERSGVELDVQSLAARLEEREAVVGFRRFRHFRLDVVDELDSTGQPAVKTTSVESLCAFVVRRTKHGTGSDTAPTATLTLIDFGPLAPIERAARAWREAIGAGLERGMAAVESETDTVNMRGDELRRLVFDPLVAALDTTDRGSPESKDRVVIALDDVLHLVPLDALPLAGSHELVGDHWRIETRATLTELLADSAEPTGTALVALGGASFNTLPLALTADDIDVIEEADQTRVARLLRGTVWERGFGPLTHAAEEARGVCALYTECFDGERLALVLEKRKASREALEELAPRARYLHIATHGWFTSEAVRSWNDPEPLDKQTGLGSRVSGAEQVKGMSPMLLCGLALAGANLPADQLGRVRGLVTADELSTLDLSNCELVVLSACDTNVGERRAGQGVASLQKALQMAGARSVITSLWKVPDEATKDLMLDFYRRLWVEKKPKHQALWEAKTKLREAQDERGEPKYTTRDWAAWVLTGDPE